MAVKFDCKTILGHNKYLEEMDILLGDMDFQG